MLMDIISLKNQLHPAPLAFREQRMFYLALYDLDEFRRHLRVNGLPQELALKEDEQAAMAGNDLELLIIAHKWIKWALFGKGLLR
jgi:hypothetical protein